MEMGALRVQCVFLNTVCAHAYIFEHVLLMRRIVPEGGSCQVTAEFRGKKG